MLHRNVRFAVAATAAAGLVTGGIASSAVAGPHASHAQRTSVVASYRAGIVYGKLKLTGPSRIPAGLVSVSLHSVNNESELGTLSFKRGYSWQDFIRDRKGTNETDKNGQPTKAALRHYRNLVRH